MHQLLKDHDVSVLPPDDVSVLPPDHVSGESRAQGEEVGEGRLLAGLGGDEDGIAATENLSEFIRAIVADAMPGMPQYWPSFTGLWVVEAKV
jgi:hypothetical protein